MDRIPIDQLKKGKTYRLTLIDFYGPGRPKIVDVWLDSIDKARKTGWHANQGRAFDFLEYDVKWGGAWYVYEANYGKTWEVCLGDRTTN